MLSRIFGAMDVLCGTDRYADIRPNRFGKILRCSQKDQGVLKLAYINSFYQTGLKNILDKAVLKYEKLVVKRYKVDEMPFLIFPEGSCQWSLTWRENIRSMLKVLLKKF